MRSYDLVARYGERSSPCSWREASAPQARIMAERCRARIEGEKLRVAGAAVAVTASLGIAAYPCDGVSCVEQLVELADQALYRAKQAGRNQVAVAA